MQKKVFQSPIQICDQWCLCDLRQGSLLTTQPSVMEEDDENLRDPDMEDVAVHR